MKLVQSQAKDLHVVTPKIAFDQPLWAKAIGIVKTKSMAMVVMLGGFQLLMSFLGSIGWVMNGSGLEDAIEQIYGKSTVPHLIFGKAVSTALRGHFLVESALVSQSIEPLISIENNLEQEEMENEIYNNAMPRKAVKKIDDL